MDFKTYNIVLTEEIRTKITLLAKKKGLSFSAYVRLLLDDHAKEAERNAEAD